MHEAGDAYDDRGHERGHPQRDHPPREEADEDHHEEGQGHGRAERGPAHRLVDGAAADEEGAESERRQGELEQDAPQVRDQREGGELLGAVAPRAQHHVVQRHAGCATEGHHVADRAAGEVQGERPTLAEAGQRTGQHEGVDEQPERPDHHEHRGVRGGHQLQGGDDVVERGAHQTRQHHGQQGDRQAERDEHAEDLAGTRLGERGGRRFTAPSATGATSGPTPGAWKTAGVPFTLVSFHAHPDDEALLTGGTLARAAADGHRVVLVTATAGEAGLSGDGMRDAASLEARRRRELAESARALGCARWEILGYADSGFGPGGTQRRRFRHAGSRGSRAAPGRDPDRGERRRADGVRRAGWLRPPRPRAGAPRGCAGGAAGRDAGGAGGDGRQTSAPPAGPGDGVAARGAWADPVPIVSAGRTSRTRT